MIMKELATRELTIKSRKVVGVQLVSGIILALAAGLMYSQWHGVSLLYGAMISTLSSIWLSYGVSKAAQASGPGHYAEIALYLGAALRFIMVLVLFIVALAYLKLVAIATVFGFIIAQLAFVVAGSWQEK